MTLADLEALFQQMRELDLVVGTRRASNTEALEAVAESRGIVLPTDYREFYSRYDYLQLEADEFTGPINLSYALETLEVRRPLPSHLLPVLSSGDGGWFFLFCNLADGSRIPNHGQVHYTETGHLRDLEFQKDSLYEFIATRASMWIDFESGDEA